MASDIPFALLNLYFDDRRQFRKIQGRRFGWGCFKQVQSRSQRLDTDIIRRDIGESLAQLIAEGSFISSDGAFTKPKNECTRRHHSDDCTSPYVESMDNAGI